MTTRAPSLRDAGALGSPSLDRESRHYSEGQPTFSCLVGSCPWPEDSCGHPLMVIEHEKQDTAALRGGTAGDKLGRPDGQVSPRHYSDHDGDVIDGIVNALLIEAMVAFFVLAMLTINVSAILKVFVV